MDVERVYRLMKYVVNLSISGPRVGPKVPRPRALAV